MDTGAYARIGAFLPLFTLIMTPGTYAIPHVETEARSIMTNAVPTEPFRGAGRPEATLTIERMVELYAAETGIDPIEARLPPGDTLVPVNGDGSLRVSVHLHSGHDSPLSPRVTKAAHGPASRAGPPYRAPIS